MAEPELGSELAGLVGIGLALGIPFGAALLGLRRRSGAWATSVSIGVAAAEAPVFLAATAVGLAWARFGVLVGVAAGGATLVALLVWTAWSHRRRREAVAAVDALEAWAIVELARADQDGARTG